MLRWRSSQSFRRQSGRPTFVGRSSEAGAAALYERIFEFGSTRWTVLLVAMLPLPVGLVAMVVGMAPIGWRMLAEADEHWSTQRDRPPTPRPDPGQLEDPTHDDASALADARACRWSHASRVRHFG